MSGRGEPADVVRLLAPNAGPMTLEGTNTWLLRPVDGPSLVVDPGPDDPAHLAAVRAACPAGVEAVLLTHHHLDHVEAAPALATRTGAPVRAWRPDLCLPARDPDGPPGADPRPGTGTEPGEHPHPSTETDPGEDPHPGTRTDPGVGVSGSGGRWENSSEERGGGSTGRDTPTPGSVRTHPSNSDHPRLPLADGEVLELPGLTVEVVHVPGHTSDSVAFLVTTADGVRLLTGDTVLGRGTSVIAHPDGNLTDYLASLHRLQEVVADRGVRQLLPGHGPVRDQPGPVLAEYLRHRRQRLEQVRAARAAGAEGAEDVVRRVYGELEPALAQAALRSVLAQLEHLDAG